MVINYTSVYMCNVAFINNRYLRRTHFRWGIKFCQLSLVYCCHWENGALLSLYWIWKRRSSITPMPFPQSNEIIIICVCVCVCECVYTLSLFPNASSLNSQHMMFWGRKWCVPSLPYNLDNGGGKGEVRKLIKSSYFLSL